MREVQLKICLTEDKLSGLKNYIHKSLKMAEAMPKATSAGYAEGLMMDAGDGVYSKTRFSGRWTLSTAWTAQTPHCLLSQSLQQKAVGRGF